jgi:hypothetical protein
MLTQELQGTYRTRHKAELLEAVDLLVGRLAKYRSVAVYEKKTFHNSNLINSKFKIIPPEGG